jgi:hypothetical protein
VEELGEGGDGEIGAFFALDCGGELGADGLEGIDGGTVFAICHEAAVLRVIAGGHGRAVDLRGAGVNRMMVAEGDALPDQFPKIGSRFLRYEIRAHAVPDDDDDVAGFSAVRGRGAEAYGGNYREKQGEGHFSHGEIIPDAPRGIELAFKTMLFSDLHKCNRREAE